MLTIDMLSIGDMVMNTVNNRIATVSSFSKDHLNIDTVYCDYGDGWFGVHHLDILSRIPVTEKNLPDDRIVWCETAKAVIFVVNPSAFKSGTWSACDYLPLTKEKQAYLDGQNAN